MHFLFYFIRINSLYMFQALFGHQQKVVCIETAVYAVSSDDEQIVLETWIGC
jgi:hypothetical protein